jgi:outer membrane protein assembly factor BamA
MFRLLFIVISLCFSWQLFSQADSITIEAIIVEGNRKTKTSVVLRELTVVLDQKVAISDLPAIIHQSEINLINTKLFNSAKINWKDLPDSNEAAALEIKVEETWFAYPVVIFELADRNFNVWWEEQGRDLDRLNLGVRIDHLNLTGRKDKLKAKVQFGYTDKYQLLYRYPFLNKEGTWGLVAAGLYSRNREVGYKTENNKLVFHKGKNYLYNRLRLTALVYNRPRHHIFHSYKLEFYNNDIDKDIIQNYNSEFYYQGQNHLRFFILEYSFDYNDVDHFNYPIDGRTFEASIRKEGLGIYKDVDLMSVRVGGQYFASISQRWSHGHIAKVRYQLFRQRPGYYHYTAMGYSGDQLRGYEYYVIDGLDFGYLKSHIKFKLLEKKWNLGKWMFIEQFRKPTANIYAVMAVETGYVNSPFYNDTNELVNQWLVGWGPGIHMLLFNHFLLKAEYSHNALGENTLFLHFNASF